MVISNSQQPSAFSAQEGRAICTDRAQQEVFLGIFKQMNDRIASARADVVAASEDPDLSGSLVQALLDDALTALGDLSDRLGEFLWRYAPDLGRALTWEDARDDALYDAIERLQWHAEGTANSELAQAADAWRERLGVNHPRLDLNFWSQLHDEAEEFWYDHETVLDGEDEGFDLERAVNRCYSARLREADGE